MGSLEIRIAGERDSDDLFVWRNDRTTREASRSSAPIRRAQHDAWFDSVLQDASRTLFIGTTGDIKIGMVRFDHDAASRSSEVSINLNPAMRRMGLSAPLLRSAITRYQSANSARILATISKNNATSVRLFTRCGFALIDPTGEFLQFALEDALEPKAGRP